MPLLDMAEAADFLRNGGKTDCEVVVLRRQIREYLVEHRPVVIDQFSLGAAFERVAERIERGAPQELHFAKNRNAGRTHGPKLILRGKPVFLSRRANSGGAR